VAFPGSCHFPLGDVMIPVSSLTYKDIQLKIKEVLNMKRLPRQLNVFFFFLSVYRLDYYNNQYKYEKKYQIDSNYHDNFVSDTYCLSWISKGKLQSLNIKSKDYLPYFQKFTIKFSDKTMTRCERFQWTPEAHKFFEQFLELQLIEFELFKEEMNNGKNEEHRTNGCI
jgi:hypothetical protein